MVEKRKPNRKKKTGPTLAMCKKLTETPSQAVVFQKLCHYGASAPFKLGNYDFAAPSTPRLMGELGYSRSTVQSALKFLNDQGLVEFRYKRHGQSERRYVRIRHDPVDRTSTPPRRKTLEGHAAPPERTTPGP